MKTETKSLLTLTFTEVLDSHISRVSAVVLEHCTVVSIGAPIRPAHRTPVTHVR